MEDGKPLHEFANHIEDSSITVFHYGWCRPDPILLLKNWRQRIDFWGMNYWEQHSFPYKFDNPSKLTKFEGQHPKWMKNLIRQKWRWNEEFNKDYQGFPWNAEKKRGGGFTLGETEEK